MEVFAVAEHEAGRVSENQPVPGGVVDLKPVILDQAAGVGEGHRVQGLRRASGEDVVGDVRGFSSVQHKRVVFLVLLHSISDVVRNIRVSHSHGVVEQIAG